MIYYNVTIKVVNEIHDEWLQWMKEVHIPDVMATGYFVEYRMSRLLIDEDDGVTYSIQYGSKSIEDYNNYMKYEAPRLQGETVKRYKDKFVAFRTLMEQVARF